MDSIEITGENVEDAIAKGLAELGAGPNDVIVEVLEEPSRGVFGLGARPARVRLQRLIKRPVVADVEPMSAPPSSITEPSQEYYEDEDDIEYLGQTEFSDGETTEDDATVGKEVLTELLEKMGIDAKITIRRAESSRQDESTPWLLDVSGDDMNSLIGRRGDTLASLQYVARLIASRRLERRANIIVDVAGYKSRRSQRLRELAVRMADQAVQQRRTVTLEPMPPHERRIIHLVLRNHAEVYTKSVGEGESRKVTIVPK
jgi:spoIIIJ-associated protein